MKLTGIGKFVLFILVVGIAIGGWRFWQQQQGSPGGSTTVQPSTPSNPSSPKTNPPKNAPTPTTNVIAPLPNMGDNDILFVITPAKKGWVTDQVEAFNKKYAGKYRVVTTPAPSREGMHAILSGTLKPVLWSPGSPVWPSRLAQVWKARYANTLVDMSDPNAHRPFLRSPLVFITTKQKAKFLRPLLGGPRSWEMIRELSLGKRKVPWGRFRFSHADPLTSSSGMMTLGLIMADYAQRNGQSGSMDNLATDKKFLKYLTELEKGLVYDDAAEKGTTALAKAFFANPSRYDFITAYESAALEAMPNNPNLAVIYPNPTAVSEHAVTLLNGGWVTPTQREGALAFITFLGSPESLRSGIEYHFRPAQSGGELSLNSELSRYAGQGFQQSYSSIELPGYQATNAAIFQWRVKVAGKPGN